jgi:Arc/MetJ family transcription regulator
MRFILRLCGVMSAKRRPPQPLVKPAGGLKRAYDGNGPRLFLCPVCLGLGLVAYTQIVGKMVYIIHMGRTNIVIDENLIRKARKLTRLRTKRQIVDRALDLLVRSESRKGILKYYGSGIWQGDLKTTRRNRV